MEMLQNICRWRCGEPANAPYWMKDACNQMPDELKPEHGYQECYQGFTKYTESLKSYTDDSKQFRNLELLGILPQLLRKWLSDRTVFSVIQSDERKSKRNMFGQWKPLQCLHVKAERQCLKLQKKRTKSSSRLMCHYPRFWFIYMWSMVSY